ncbi:MAG TPA: hypothetical protein VFS38_01110 [Actinomycetota bacterium]|nr:hypothetical protein [Actinomycetota bacterium]
MPRPHPGGARGGTTEVFDRLRREHRIRPPGPGLPVTDLRRALGSASLAFGALLCIGMIFLLALKLQFEQLGEGFNPLAVVAAGGVMALASLGAPLRLGQVEVAVIPLGAVALLGLALTWSSSSGAAAIRHRGGDRAGPLARGLLVGLLFAFLCLLGALAFRFRGGPDPVSVAPFETLLWGLVWGSLFGVAGALRSQAPLLVQLTALARALETRFRLLYEGLCSGLVMLIGGAVMSCAALLLAAIVALLRGSAPLEPTWRSLGSMLIYVLFFAPNVVLTCLALSLGAPVEVGGRISVAGNSFGRLVDYSLLDGGGAPLPVYASLLLLVPLVACLLGGAAARRRAADHNAALEVVGVAALTFGALVVVAAALAEARLGAGLFGRRGVARVAAAPLEAGLLACGWGAALGWAGWRLQEWRSRR